MLYLVTGVERVLSIFLGVLGVNDLHVRNVEVAPDLPQGMSCLFVEYVT